MVFIRKLRKHALPGENLWGGSRGGRGPQMSGTQCEGDGVDPTPFIPYLGCFPPHIDRRVD